MLVSDYDFWSSDCTDAYSSEELECTSRLLYFLSSNRMNGYATSDELDPILGQPTKQEERVKHIEDVPITPKQLEALSEIKRRLVEKFDIEAFVLYGSVARGEADEESDVDLLVVTSKPLTRFERQGSPMWYSK